MPLCSTLLRGLGSTARASRKRPRASAAPVRTECEVSVRKPINDSTARISPIRPKLERFGKAPKAIYMQNHGFIVVGTTDKEVLNITQMAVKTAKILLGTYAMGGPHFLPDEHVNRIETRPDEHYRRKVI